MLNYLQNLIDSLSAQFSEIWDAVVKSPEELQPVRIEVEDETRRR